MEKLNQDQYQTPHSEVEYACGLNKSDIFTQIELYEKEKDISYNAEIFEKHNDIKNSADLPLRAWMDADNIVSLCDRFFRTEENKQEKHKFLDIQLCGKNDRSEQDDTSAWPDKNKKMTAEQEKSAESHKNACMFANHRRIDPNILGEAIVSSIELSVTEFYEISDNDIAGLSYIEDLLSGMADKIFEVSGRLHKRICDLRNNQKTTTEAEEVVPDAAG